MVIIKKIKGFILDLDGIITDTADYHFQSWKKMIEAKDLDFNKEVNEKLRGLTREKSLEVILDYNQKKDSLSTSEKEKLLKEKNDYYKEYISSLSHQDLLPGIKNILETLHHRNYKMAVASSSKNARPIIKKLKLRNYFEVIADGNSVEKNKPAPDLFVFTAQKMEINPENCVVIEDSAAGVKAGLAANMLVIGIGPKDRIGQAHFCYSQVKNIDLEEILSKKNS